MLQHFNLHLELTKVFSHILFSVAVVLLQRSSLLILIHTMNVFVFRGISASVLLQRNLHADIQQDVSYEVTSTGHTSVSAE